MRSKAITLYIAFIALVTGLVSCSEWNTNSVGSKFTPANSQVRNFRRQVFVEYGPHHASVWGEAADLVESEVDGGHVRLKFEKDSIAIFVYGYTTADTTQIGGDASLTIQARTKTGYALYLSGTSIYNPHGPAIQSLGTDQCFIVLPSNSRNVLTTIDMKDATGNANACLYCEGPLQISGSGTLDIKNLTTTANIGNAISAGAFGCSYNITANVKAASGYAIQAKQEVAISSGKWDLSSGLSNIKGSNVLLISGSFNANCQRGSFVETKDKYSVPAILRNPTVTALASNYSYLADSITMASLGYIADSLYYPKQYKADFEFKKDSTYTIHYRRDSVEKQLTTFKASANLSDGYLLISTSSLKNRDEVFVTE